MSQTETQHAYFEQVVENTPAMVAELEEKIPEETIDAIEMHAELVAARQALLPEFIRVVVGEVPTPSDTLQAMQAMKERAVEHVRYRAVGEFNDVEIQAVLQGMHEEAYRYHREHEKNSDTYVLMPKPWPGFPFLSKGSASQISEPMTPQEFIVAAHNRSLQVTKFKKNDEVNLRKQYQVLLSDFPKSTVLKVGDEQLDTPVGRGKALTQLVALHSGEVVELDRARTSWHLRRKSAPGSASAGSVPEWQSPQWHCLEHGRPVGQSTDKPGRDEYGRSAVMNVKSYMEDQAKHAATRMGLKHHDFLPAWDEQTNRVLVPCKNADEWQWHRSGPVITLGELFMALGKNYTASAIYNFYRTCRLVVIKKGKHAQSNRGTPGSASLTGITGGALQATAIRREYNKKKDLLVEEYITVNNFSDDYVKSLTKERLLNDAIQFMHQLLLQEFYGGSSNTLVNQQHLSSNCV